VNRESRTESVARRWLQRFIRYQLRHALIVLVETVTRNRLAATSGARLQITTNLVQSTSRRSAIITLGMIQIIRTLTIRNTIKLLAIDDEVSGTHLGLFVAVPSRLFGIPRHADDA